MIQLSKALWAIVGLLTQLHLTDGNSHQPWNWEFYRWKGLPSNEWKKVQTWSGSGNPNFKIPSCELVPIEPCHNRLPVYLCPAATEGRSYCNSPGEYYCAYWGCEMVATEWQPSFPNKNLKLSGGHQVATHSVIGKEEEKIVSI